MNFFKNMRVRIKLIMSFVIVAIFIGVVVTIDIVSLNTVDTNSGYMYILLDKI